MYQAEEKDANDDEAKFNRRMKAYREMADQQISDIIRAMVSYGDGRASMRLSDEFTHVSAIEEGTIQRRVTLDLIKPKELDLNDVAVQFRNDLYKNVTESRIDDWN